MKKQSRQKPKDKGKQFNINRQIRAVEIRLVGDNVENGVINTREALKLANKLDLDLIEISPNAKPPVCKIMEHSKFIYELKKKDKDNQKNQKIKEIRFTPNTDEHDLEFKLKHAINFLEKGNLVKASVFFKGRMIKYKEQGEIILLKFVSELSEYGSAITLPKMEGSRMAVTIKPKK